MKKGRRKARSIALQVLYEVDCTTHAIDDVVYHRMADANLSTALQVFVEQLVRGTLAYQPALDETIHQHAPEWPFEQMAIVDRNILRMAIWEFTLSDETPTKVAINEAVELAKRFGSDSAPAFINGVLGTLAAKEHDLRRHLANYTSDLAETASDSTEAARP